MYTVWVTIQLPPSLLWAQSQRTSWAADAESGLADLHGHREQGEWVAPQCPPQPAKQDSKPESDFKQILYQQLHILFCFVVKRFVCLKNFNSPCRFCSPKRWRVFWEMRPQEPEAPHRPVQELWPAAQQCSYSSSSAPSSCPQQGLTANKETLKEEVNRKGVFVRNHLTCNASCLDVTSEFDVMVQIKYWILLTMSSYCTSEELLLFGQKALVFL